MTLPALPWFLVRGRRWTTPGAVDRGLRLAPGTTIEALHGPAGRGLEVGADFLVLGPDGPQGWRQVLPEGHADAPSRNGDLVLVAEPTVRRLAESFLGVAAAPPPAPSRKPPRRLVEAFARRYP